MPQSAENIKTVLNVFESNNFISFHSAKGNNDEKKKEPKKNHKTSPFEITKLQEVCEEEKSSPSSAAAKRAKLSGVVSL